MVKIKIDGDAAAFEKKLKDLDAIGEKALKGLKVAAVAAGTALVAMGTMAFKAGKEYETAFAGVEKTVDASARELAVMRKALIDMSGEIPLAATELAGIATAAGQLGIASGDILGFTKVMANLGVATNMTAEEAATMLARFANVTGLDPSKYENLGSAVVALGNNMATTESEIVLMAQRMAGAATNAGFAEAEILALAASLSSVGIEAQAGGGSMTRVLNQMDKDIKAGGANLEAFASIAGMSANEFAAAWGQNAAGAFDLFVQGLGRVQAAGGSVSATLETVGISETIATVALTNLAGAGGLLTNALDLANTAFEENTALANEAAAQYKTMESQLQFLKNGVTAVGISMYDAFRGAALDAVTSLRQSVVKLNVELNKPDARLAIENIGKAFASLIKTAGQLVTAVLPPLIKALALVANNANVLLPVTLGLVAAFKLFSVLNTVSAAYRAVSDATSKASALLVSNNSLTLAGVSTQAMMSAALSTKTGAELLNAAAKKAGMTIDVQGNLITAQGTVATAAETAAVLSSSGAITAKTALIGIQTGYVKLATAAKWLWNAAMSANHVGLVVAGVVALTGVLIGLGIALRGNNEEMEAATGRANELKTAQENLSNTVRDSATAFDESVTAIDVQTETATRLVAKIREVSASNLDAAAKSAQLRIAVGQLNQVMPKLGVAYDETTGKVIGLTDAVDASIASTDKALKAEAYRERALQLINEQVVAEISLAKVEEDMIALKKAGMATTESYSAIRGEITVRDTEAYAILKESAAGYNDTLVGINGDLKIYNKLSDESSEEGRKAAEAHAFSEENLKSLADQYGVTVEAIRAATDGTIESMDLWVGAQNEAAAAAIEATEAMEAEIAEGLARVADAYQTSNDRIDLSNAASLATRIENIKANQQLSDEYAANLAYLGEQAGIELDAGLLAELQRGDAEAFALAQQIVESIKAGDGKWLELNEYYKNKMGEGIESIATAAHDGVPVVADATETVGDGAIEGFRRTLGGAPADYGDSLVTEAAGGVSGNSALQNASQASGQEAIVAVKGAIESGNPMGIGRNFIEDITTGIRSTKSTLITAAKSAVTDAVTAARDAGTASITRPIGVAMVTGVSLGVTSTQATMISTAKAAVTSAVAAATDAGSAGNTYSIGSNMMDGITNGINAGASGVINAMVSAVNQAIAAAKAAAKISSPSKRTRKEIGAELGTGLALGIKDSTPDVTKAATQQMQEVLDTYENAEAPTLQTRFLAEFGEVPLKFFEAGRLAGEQFVTGFNLASMGFMSMLETIIMGRPLMSVGENERSRTVGDVNINFNQPVDSPDAYARTVRNVFDYGLAGERN